MSLNISRKESWGTFEACAQELKVELSANNRSIAEVEEAEVPDPLYELDSEQESIRLAQLKEALDPETVDQLSEGQLLSALRGRRYLVAEAAARIPLYLKMRKEYNLDKSSDQLQKDITTGKISLIGSKDVEGRPIVLLRLRYHDVTTCDSYNMVRCLLFVLELAMKDPVAQQRGVTFIQDCEGVSPAHIDFEVLRRLFSDIFPRFPGRIGVVLVLNPPALVKRSVDWFLELLRPRVQRRVKILGSSNAILEFVAEDHLPVSYGGKMSGMSNDALMAVLEMAS
mmetsp:Transcript_25481/g.35103  ORF Transcript_25481/g.35103 Transcript_25481/m.35103 type:complete len:283 (-) Transcript_25481:115-963(-)